MKIAVHHAPGSFSDRWIASLAAKGVPYEHVDLFATDVIPRLRGFDGLLAHLSHNDPTALAFGHSILRAAEAAGLVVFPRAATYAHFDDKVAQKYLLEAVEAPLVPTFVAHRLDDALRFVASATYPIVFKLRRGAGSANVRLVGSAIEGEKLCRQAFGAGFVASPSFVADGARKLRSLTSLPVLLEKLSRAPRTIRRNLSLRAAIPRERGYVYFQEFIPEATHDIRVTVIGDRAFTFRRRTRPGDFRASGSGLIEHGGPGEADLEAVRSAFEIARSLGGDSLAFDFVHDPRSGRRLVIELSYAYKASAVHDCPGHFTPSLEWVPGHVWPEEAILTDLLARLGG